MSVRGPVVEGGPAASQSSAPDRPGSQPGMALVTSQTRVPHLFSEADVASVCRADGRISREHHKAICPCRGPALPGCQAESDALSGRCGRRQGGTLSGILEKVLVLPWPPASV